MHWLESNSDTAAWVFQVWASFVLAFGATAAGIYYLPLDAWVRGYLAMGLLFTVGSCFSLAKTIRDRHESARWANRLSEAKAQKLIGDFEIQEKL